MFEILPILHADVLCRPDLLEAYAKECRIAALGDLEPQWGVYSLLENTGMLRGFGVYAGTEMVGFASLLISVLPHYGALTATVESLFVMRGYRRRGAGSALLRHMEKVAKAEGCRAILYSAPAGGQLEALLDKRYARTNSVFCKPLVDRPGSAAMDPGR